MEGLWEEVWLLEGHGSRTGNFSFSLYRQQRGLRGLPGPFAFCLLCSRGHLGGEDSQSCLLDPSTPCLPAQWTVLLRQPNNTTSLEDPKLWSPVHPGLPSGFLIAMKVLASLQCPKSHGHLISSFSPRAPRSVLSIILFCFCCFNSSPHQ